MIHHINDITKAIDILNSGGVIIFPTDTVYGIGCRLDKPEAIEKVFTIRKRPLEKAVLIVVDSIEMVQQYLRPISQDVKILMHQYWPGGLTIILPCLVEKVPAIARANGTTLAVRQTNHSFLLEILKKTKVPLIAPSANFAGEKTPKTFEEIDPALLSLVDYAVQGVCGGDSPSTIIDCSSTKWKIVRKGQIKLHVTLKINTLRKEEVSVAIQIENKECISTHRNTSRNSQYLLPLIAQSIEKHGLLFSDITHIEVAQGEGSFTGIRVGISVANALQYALSIPGPLIEPTYSM